MMSQAFAHARSRCRGFWCRFVALAALLAILTALWHLEAASDGIRTTQTSFEGVPLTLYRPASGEPAPAVVIGHGFAGSRRMMQPYALTLARAGYLVVAFDFPGHGQNAAPFVATLEDRDERLRRLFSALEPAIRFALAQPEADGRLALLGHSMAGDPLARHAAAHSEVAATLLVSPYLGEEAPVAAVNNLMLIYGALEPRMLQEQGLAAIAPSGSGLAEPGVLYGDPAAGSARKLVLAEGVEHIGVLYGVGGLEAARDWLDLTFGRDGGDFVDRRGGWLGLLYLGLIALAWPLSRLLPCVAQPPRGAGLPWRRLWPAALAPAVLTPLLLWKLPTPTQALPVLLADYLVLHFALYGVLTLAALAIVNRRGQPDDRGGQPGAQDNLGWRPLVLAALAVSLYAVLAIALPTDRFVTTLLPGPERWPLVLTLLAGTLLYFAADEWLTRGAGAARGAYAATKALFLLSLMLAVALNLHQLFFLVIIIPAILLLFMIYGLFSGWSYRRTGHPLPAAIAGAIAFASAIVTTFPVVG